jgi:alkylation response protein AidB-like acyl-CoA dehydrogenase
MATVERADQEPTPADPTYEEFVARAVALKPLLREHAAAADSARRIPDEVMDALIQAGVFRLMTPKRYGGYQRDLRTVMKVSEVLGEADASVSWLVAMGSLTNSFACLPSTQAGEEVFGSDPDARVVGALTPRTVSSRRVVGGWRVSGSWANASGAWHATWVYLGVPLTDETGQVVDHALVLAPASELLLRDTWLMAGMRATGSNTFVAEDVFVPEHRVLSLATAFAGTDFSSRDPNNELYHAALGALAAPPLVAPVLGMGHAALAWVTEKARDKPLTHTIYSTQAGSVGVQLQVAEAALKIETASLHAYRAVDDLDRSALRGEQLDYFTRSRMRAQCGYAVQQVLEAINILLNVHGAAGFAEESPLQRYWRDANTAARHVALNLAVGYETYGKSLLGVQERITELV